LPIEPVVVKIRRMPEFDDLPLPQYMTPGAAGADLVAALTEPLTLVPGARALVPTGLTLELPEGYEAQIRPRSGLALEHGLTLLNTPGTIDSDYRGPVGVIVVNHGDAPHTIRRGDRIAQLVVAPVVRASFATVRVLASSHRDAGGFGSTDGRPVAKSAPRNDPA